MAQNWLNYPISHGYLTGYQGPGTDTPHYAVDVATPFHTPVTALFSGTVKQVDAAYWSNQPGGIEEFIQPDDKSLPEYYYYHLDTTYDHAGQHVQAGEQIGLSGGQNQGGNNPVSTMWSSGPHTHVGFFQKYVDTPVGSRPYGPDITGYVTQGAKNPVLPLSSYNGALPGSGNNSIFGLSLPNINYADAAYRIAFVILGILFVFLGLKHFLSVPVQVAL